MADVIIDCNLVSNITDGTYSIANRSGGGSDGDAYANIEDAFVAGAGSDVFLLRGGTYTEDNHASENDRKYPQIMIPTNRNGTALNWTTLKSYPGEWAIIDGEGLHPTYGVDPDRAVLGLYGDTGSDAQINYWRFESFEIKNGDRCGLWINRGPFYIKNLSVHDCYLQTGSGNPAGISGYTWQNSVVEYCYFKDNGTPPGTGDTVDPQNSSHLCIFTDYSGSGLDPKSEDVPDIDEACHSNEIRYNYFDTGYNGFKHKGCQRLGEIGGGDFEHEDKGDKIHHNLFVDCEYASIKFDQDFCQIYNNVCYGGGIFSILASYTYLQNYVTIYNNTVKGREGGIRLSRKKQLTDEDNPSEVAYYASLYTIEATYIDYHYHPYFYCYNNIVDGDVVAWDAAAISLGQSGVSTPEDHGDVDYTDTDIDYNFTTDIRWHPTLLLAEDEHYSTPVYDPEDMDLMGTRTVAEFNTEFGVSNYTNENSGLYQGESGVDQYIPDPDFVVGTTEKISDGGKGGSHPFLSGVTLPSYVGPVDPNDTTWVSTVLNLNQLGQSTGSMKKRMSALNSLFLARPIISFITPDGDIDFSDRSNAVNIYNNGAFEISGIVTVNEENRIYSGGLQLGMLSLAGIKISPENLIYDGSFSFGSITIAGANLSSENKINVGSLLSGFTITGSKINSENLILQGALSFGSITLTGIGLKSENISYAGGLTLGNKTISGFTIKSENRIFAGVIAGNTISGAHIKEESKVFVGSLDGLMFLELLSAIEGSDTISAPVIEALVKSSFSQDILDDLDDIIFDTDELAKSCTLYFDDGTSQTIAGIFDNDGTEVDLGETVIQSLEPVLEIADHKLTKEVNNKCWLLIDGKKFTVKNTQPDGLGTTTLVLNRR